VRSGAQTPDLNRHEFAQDDSPDEDCGGTWCLAEGRNAGPFDSRLICCCAQMQRNDSESSLRMTVFGLAVGNGWDIDGWQGPQQSFGFVSFLYQVNHPE
jgi:hypothetical protein